MDAELNELLSYSFQKINGNGKLILSLLQLSKKYFNLPETDCQNEHERYLTKLRTIKHKPMAQKKNYLDKKYILRNGTLLYYNNTHFSNDTLTDKIAENAIKKFPNLEGLFLTDKEHKVLKAIEQGADHVQEAEADVVNDSILKEIAGLVENEQYEDAREKAKTLAGDEAKEDSLKFIDEVEEKAVEDAIKAEEAEKKAAAKKIADKKAEEAGKGKKDPEEK